MAKKIVGYIKLQIPAGKANPSPPVGPALGQRIAGFDAEGNIDCHLPARLDVACVAEHRHVDELPAEKRLVYNLQRRSNVLMKEL